MTEINDIKARVVIEYDGSGIDKAKKDLTSLADIVGGDLAESTGGANEALSSLDEQMSRNAESASDFVTSVGSLEKPLGRSGDAVSSMTEALVEQQSVIEDTGTAFENIQKPIEQSTSLMEEASPPMLAISKNAQTMHEQLSVVNDSFASIGESLSQTVPLMPQFSDSLHGISESFDPSVLSDFHENFSAFQDALVNPEPYELVHQYLSETGQTWHDFSSSIGEDNATTLDNYTAFRDAFSNPEPFQMIQQHLEDTGQTWHDFSSSIGEENATILTSMANTGSGAEEFTKQWNSMGESIASVNKSGGVGAAMEGLGGAGEGFSFSGITGALWDIASPIMAVQFIAQAVGSVGKGIYDMAAIAEGPAAHGIGTFTGAVDVLNQHAQDAAEQFSEGFGQGIKPMLDAINNVTGQTDGGGFLSDFGHNLGGTLNVLGDLAQIVGGGAANLGSLGFTLNTNDMGNGLMQSGWEGLQNTWADITGGIEPFPTSGASSQIMVNMPAIQQSMAQSIAMMNAQASNPQYLAAQAYLGSQQGYAQLGQAGYDISHLTVTGDYPGATSYSRDAFAYAPQSYQNSMAAYALANGGSGYGLSDIDLNRAYFNSFPYQSEPNTTVSCFPAGTPVLMADGTAKAIETLQIGEHVKAHDGAKQVVTTILDLIKPLQKRVYELLFDDGNTLTLTDSHPISTLQGWKSLSPESTKRENPDLAVSSLQIGDCIHTVYGTCTLVAIVMRNIVQVYNLTVDEPHTFYASGILVHNKTTIATQVAQNVADTSVPQTDMKNTTLIQSLASNFIGADLSHTFTATVDWQANGLNHGFTGQADWQAMGLENVFEGNASWVGHGLQNLFEGAADWVGHGLQNTFKGAADWLGEGLDHLFNGNATWHAEHLDNTFDGNADWEGKNLDHTFIATANWQGQGLSQSFMLSPTGIPGFASGVEGFGGGLAVVGEAGPELVRLPENSSVYPQSSLSGLSSLGIGGDSGPIVIHIHQTTTLDGKVVAQETIPHIAPMLRRNFGVRQ